MLVNYMLSGNNQAFDKKIKLHLFFDRIEGILTKKVKIYKDAETNEERSMQFTNDEKFTSITEFLYDKDLHRKIVGEENGMFFNQLGIVAEDILSVLADLNLADPRKDDEKFSKIKKLLDIERADAIFACDIKQIVYDTSKNPEKKLDEIFDLFNSNISNLSKKEDLNDNSSRFKLVRAIIKYRNLFEEKVIRDIIDNFFKSLSTESMNVLLREIDSNGKNLFEYCQDNQNKLDGSISNMLQINPLKSLSTEGEGSNSHQANTSQVDDTHNQISFPSYIADLLYSFKNYIYSTTLGSYSIDFLSHATTQLNTLMETKLGMKIPKISFSFSLTEVISDIIVNSFDELAKQGVEF
jgi:hypothetical protein